MKVEYNIDHSIRATLPACIKLPWWEVQRYSSVGTGIHGAIGNLFASLLCEVKLWLYHDEGMLETGLPTPPGGAHCGLDLLQLEALQRNHFMY